MILITHGIKKEVYHRLWQYFTKVEEFVCLQMCSIFQGLFMFGLNYAQRLNDVPKNRLMLKDFFEILIQLVMFYWPKMFKCVCNI